MNVLAPVKTPARPSPLRAWFALVGVSLKRQARARQMVWVALGLLLVAVALVGLRTARTGWSSGGRNFPYGTVSGKYVKGPSNLEPTLNISRRRIIEQHAEVAAAVPIGSPALAVEWAVAGALELGLERTRVFNFTLTMFSLFIGFLLPLWSLSFATEAIGGERESRSIVWLLTRPLPRWSIYVGKYVALLPWALGLNLGGFGLMCWAAGPPGREAFRLFWPAIAAGTLAFASVFHLIAAATRRPTVVGLVYCFFLESLLGDMPGLMKRASVSFYVRCLIFDAASDYGIAPDKPSVYLPVSGPVAWATLVGITVVALVLGAFFFSRSEYRDDGA